MGAGIKALAPLGRRGEAVRAVALGKGGRHRLGRAGKAGAESLGTTGGFGAAEKKKLLGGRL